MTEKIMIICDKDIAYAKRLVERMIETKSFNSRYRLKIFDSLFALFEYCSRVKQVSVLIIGENLLDMDSGDDLYPKFKAAGIHEIYLLLEHDATLEQRQYTGFYKYQASSLLIRKLEETIAKKKDGREVIVDNDVKILGFFSPRGSVEKTIFACLAGLGLGAEKGVLYINLERYSGFEALFGRKTGKNMTEAIFYLLREDDVPSADMITDTFEEYEGLWYLPPINKALEFEGLREDMLPFCIQRLKTILQKEELAQRLIILDFNGEVQGYVKLLELCDSLYVIERNDCISENALDSFYEEMSDYNSEITESMRAITVPVINEFTGNKFIETRAGREFEALVWKKLKEEGFIEGGVKTEINQ